MYKRNLVFMILFYLIVLSACGGETALNGLAFNDNEVSAAPVQNEEYVNDSIESSAADEISDRKPDDALEMAQEPPTGYNPVRVNHIVSDGTILRWMEYAYNADGNKTTETTYSSEGVMSWEVYEYDADGNQIKLSVYSHPDSYLLLGEETSDEEVLVEWRDFQYDDTGKQIKVTPHNADGSVDTWWEYLYDDKGNRVKEVHFSTYDEPEAPMYWTEYEYDEHGEKTKETIYNFDGSISHTTAYSYNELREQFAETYYDGNGEITGTGAYVPVYDDNGRLTKETFFNSSGEITYWLEYIY
jgi:hypothetical protein